VLEAEAGVELLPLLVLAAPAWICGELEKEERMRATAGTNGRPHRQPDGGMDASHRWKRSAAYLRINVGPAPFFPNMGGRKGTLAGVGLNLFSDTEHSYRYILV
jgi:hypothetical protein